MNDFTKKELSYLLGALNNLHANYMPELATKIQSMIDNYCDHDFENTYSEREVWRCSKCDEETN